MRAVVFPRGLTNGRRNHRSSRANRGSIFADSMPLNRSHRRRGAVSKAPTTCRPCGLSPGSCRTRLAAEPSGPRRPPGERPTLGVSRSPRSPRRGRRRPRTARWRRRGLARLRRFRGGAGRGLPQPMVWGIFPSAV